MQDERIKLIPTDFRSKIPQTLSYPLGAEALSLAFADVPQFESLTVDFFFYSRVRPEVENTYPILEIAYSRFGKTVHFVAEEQLRPKWQVKVRPVTRDRRHLIKMKLQNEALPFARDWLVKNAAHDEVGRLELTFSFDEETESLLRNERSTLEPGCSR